MYTPPKFRVADDEMWEILQRAGAGILVRTGPEGLASVVVPVSISEDRTTLHAHLARANGWWHDAAAGDEVIAVFLASSAYVSPTYYPSLADDHNAVPTWNYEAVEVRGRLTVHDSTEWLAEQVTDVTNHFEEGRAPRWWTSDIDPEYFERQLRAIVGISIEITSIEGKAKLSQNRPAVDRDSVRQQFARGPLNEQLVAEAMARVAEQS